MNCSIKAGYKVEIFPDTKHVFHDYYTPFAIVDLNEKVEKKSNNSWVVVNLGLL